MTEKREGVDQKYGKHSPPLVACCLLVKSYYEIKDRNTLKLGLCIVKRTYLTILIFSDSI